MAADHVGVTPEPMPIDLLARVAELRTLAFELVHDVPRGYRAYATDGMSLAAVRMQSVANELGVIEGLLAEAAAGGHTLERDAA